ncbi:DUF2939 domain-containing protein [Zobellella iuensis]|uniref:DUF2939 domain-containing protein n=1 Tax=Zobellella iuensis TaxID=2803811 RepID=A0ABS1QP02_9GAMM|nr:DUF2939 domain-containing protein [Zobellella iuensis]MBL1376584.1 DUF2939 domain-containing protein [Zobellella iuensis]
MRTLKLVFVLAAVLALGYGVAAPWITVYQIREAADNRDGRALAEHVEFDSVRQSLKDQLNARMLRELGDDIRQNPLAALGAAFANVVVDGLVDTYVTPAGIEQLMRGETPAPGIPRSEPPPAGNGNDTGKPGPERRKPFSDAAMGYRSLNHFVVTMTDDSGKQAEFILSRRGLGWKLTAIVLPLD